MDLGSYLVERQCPRCGEVYTSVREKAIRQKLFCWYDGAELEICE